ncbi:MAG: hypothetical protein U0531_06180 [Dehalococcoidia bacterium]
MPNYTVNNRAVTSGWNVVAGPPGALGARPEAVLALNNSQAVAMGQAANIALGPATTGLHTMHLANCSAFCILYRPNAMAPWSRAALMHMLGGPDPNAVNWAAMTAGMPGGGIFYGVLANSQATVLSPGFVVAVLANTAIPAGNMWVYDAQSPGGVINFGIDWNGFAGEC